MEKIWVITIDEVSDYENFQNCPFAYRNEEDARKALQRFKDSIKEDYAEEIEDGGWTYQEGEYWVEVYADYYAQDHYFVKLSCVDLQ